MNQTSCHGKSELALARHSMATAFFVGGDLVKESSATKRCVIHGCKALLLVFLALICETLRMKSARAPCPQKRALFLVGRSVNCVAFAEVTFSGSAGVGTLQSGSSTTVAHRCIDEQFSAGLVSRKDDWEHVPVYAILLLDRKVRCITRIDVRTAPADAHLTMIIDEK